MIIDKIGAGHYQTRDGRPVVILCLDAPGSDPVVGYTTCSELTFEGIPFINPTAWSFDGKWAGDDDDTGSDLIPVPRKPREVWVSNEDLSTEAGVRVASVSDPGIEGFVHFREVMEDEDNA